MPRVSTDIYTQQRIAFCSVSFKGGGKGDVVASLKKMLGYHFSKHQISQMLC